MSRGPSGIAGVKGLAASASPMAARFKRDLTELAPAKV